MSEAYRRVADAMGQVPQKKEPTKFQKIVDYFVNDSIPAQAVKAAYGGFTLPRDVYQGKVDPLSNEAIDRSADLAGMVTLGAGAVPAQKNTLRAGIKAYHGSPHDFDKFSMGKIGTGEGAQAYGHGLYFADSEDVARSYRDALTDMPNILRIKNGDIDKAIVQTKANLSGLRDRIAEATARADTPSGRVVLQGWQKQFDDNVAALDKLESGKPFGRMYEVNINANPDDFLDWDKPLSEQPPGFAKVMGGYGYPEQPIHNSLQTADMVRGKGQPTGFSEELTKEMLDAGIPGIKYLDQGSRGVGAGSRNYVVFDENLIEIVKKYGIAGALAAGLLTQEQAKQFTQPQGPSQGEWEAAYKAGTGA